MQTSLQKILKVGLVAASLLGGVFSEIHAQGDYKFENPDKKYVEKTGWALGITFGVADFWGDVGTKSFLDHYKTNYFDKIRFMGGPYARYTFLPGLAVRGNISYGSLYATDAWNKKKALKATSFNDDAVQRYVRNLDMYSTIWEGNLMFEISPLDILSQWEFAKFSRIQPYFLIGVGGFHFNPRGTYENPATGYKKVVDLRELHTEGEGFSSAGMPKNYNLWAFQIPVGVGVRFDIGSRIGLGLEYTMRYTLTDYLDDVSGKYIDPVRTDIAFVNDPAKAALSNAMADKSSLIIPGYKNTPGTQRGNSDKDKYSTLSVNFFWRLKGRASAWWK